MYGIIGAICVSKKAERRTTGSVYWDVTCEFDTGREYQKSSPNRTGPDGGDNPDPTTWIPVLSIDSFETKQKVLQFDYSPTPKPIQNSAGDLFSDPVTRNVLLPVVNFVQFEDPGQYIGDIIDRNDTVNSLPFLTKAKRLFRLNVLAAALGTYATYPAWRISYKLTFDRDTWDETRLDVGPNKLITDVSKPHGVAQAPCLDSQGQFRVIGHLDGSGNQLDVAEDPAKLTFRGHPEIDFNNFIRTT
jgi:hypothetical protein